MNLSRSMPRAGRSAAPWSAFSILLSLSGAGAGAAPTPGGIPVTFTLPKSGLATVVIEDAQGSRVRNLLSGTPLAAGPHTLYWDGYDEGTRTGDGDPWEHDLIRHRVPAGAYTVRGLVHDRLTLRYEFSVNSPGTPPWKTADGSGGWLADHSPPAGILALPDGAAVPNGKGVPKLLVCSTSGESGEEFVWLDGGGRRLYGVNTGFWGGTHLARDLGPDADPATAAYVFESGERDADNDTLEVRAVRRSGEIAPATKYVFPMEWKKSVLPQFGRDQNSAGEDGVAAHNQIVAFSVTRLNKIVFGDAHTQKLLGEAAVPAPRDLFWDRKGRLLVISGRRVLRFDAVDPTTGGLGPGRTVVAAGLEDPRRLTVDGAGDLYVADWGRSHQVKVFSPAGALLRIFGQPGGPKLGHYDERRMKYPAGMTLDGMGRLWVAEADVVPKRLSVWDARTGAFVRAIYGPSQYGGGGKIDPADPTRLFMDPDWSAGIVTWKLDWKAGTARPEAVAWRSDTPGLDPMPSTAPETVLRRGGFTYLTDSYNDYLRYNQDRGMGLWRLGADEIARPAALFGNGADLVNGTWGIPLRRRDEIVKLWDGLDPATVFFVWSDTDGDGIADPSEITFRRFPKPGGGFLPDVGLGVQVLPDLSLATTWGIHVAPPTLDAHGTPRYDLAKTDTLGDPARYSERMPGGGDVVYVRIGDLGLTGSARDGSHFWRYQSVGGGQPGAGQLTQPNRMLGLPVTPRQGEAGPFVAVNSDRGGISLLTTDGLYLQTLGGDMRYVPLWRDPALFRRGASLDGISFEDEQFHPTVTQTDKDGAIYFVVGKEHSSITRLDGTETVQRLVPTPLTVGPEKVAGLPETQTTPARRTGRNTLMVATAGPAPTVDGDLSDWPTGTQWAALDARTSATAAVSGDRLYAAWKTGDPDALQSGGGPLATLFKKGGALDLMIGANPHADPRRQAPVPGDERLLVTQEVGRTRAILYRAVVPGTPAAARVEFASPVGRVDFDQVADVSDQVRLARHGGDVELSIPLTVLGLSVRPGDEILGDLGLLRGYAGQTTQRLYWNNQDAEIVSDVPSEARLSPGNWGLWKFY